MTTPTIPTFATIREDIAGIPIADLVKEFGTPTFFYDAAKIEERISDLRAFDVIRYAQKACSNLAILDLVRRNGVLVDSVSAGEIHRALRAGYVPTGDPPPIVYTADIFDQGALDLVIEHDIHVNCGSPDMIDQLGSRAPGRSITLRINPGFGHGHSQKTNTDCLERAGKHELTISGLHLHIGSGTDLEHLSQVCGALEELALQIGPSLTSISAGGGLPVPYKADESYVDLDVYFQLWDATRKRLEEQFGHSVSLEIEPGRYISAESGYLLTEIRAIKHMGENQFYLVDAGFNNLARPILYGAYHPMSVAPTPGTSTDRAEQDVVVGGPLCESGDIFTQTEGGFVCSRRLPEAQIGEHLVIECAGAYAFAMGSNYNSKPLAAEVLVRNGTAHLIRSRQTPDEIMQGEVIPKLD